MAILIGLGVALAVAAFGRISGMDRDRAFYSVILIVVASYYLLFSAMAGGAGLPVELLFFALFAGAATIGFRTSPWIVAAGLALHGLFDVTRHWVVAGSGVPDWWPAFCMGFDVLAGAGLALILLLDGRRPALRQGTAS